MTEELTPRTEGPTPRADEQRAGISSELGDITTALQSLTDHMDKSLPEERVKALLETAKADASRGRRRLAVSLSGIALIATLVSAFGLAQSRSNGKALDEIRVVSDFVQNCLQHPEELTAEERVAQCGGNDQDGAVLIQGLLRGINCGLLIPPEDRTESNLNACAAKAFTGG